MAWDREMSAEDPFPPPPLWVWAGHPETMPVLPSSPRGVVGRDTGEDTVATPVGGWYRDKRSHF